MSLSVYVASPYANAAFVRVIHESLRAHGLIITSNWAEQATGPEDFSHMTVAALRAAAAGNDRDLRASDVILVIDFEGRGRETYGELRVALEWGKAAIFVGRRNLSAWRRGVVRADDLDDAIAILVEMQGAYAMGRRGTLLAESVRQSGSDRGAA
jgi:hypothetical protein